MCGSGASGSKDDRLTRTKDPFKKAGQFFGGIVRGIVDVRSLWSPSDSLWKAIKWTNREIKGHIYLCVMRASADILVAKRGPLHTVGLHFGQSIG